MKKLAIKLLGAVIISATLSSAISPAFALGGCGPNRHMWTAPVGKRFFDVLNELVGCGHMSGLFARR
jgi:hypothetical protein